MCNSFAMRRNNLKAGARVWDNPGLLLDRGFPEWKKANEQRGEEIQKHIKNVCALAVPGIYEKAFLRWLALTGDASRFAAMVGALENRLYIGLGIPHVLETQVARLSTYGMPFIPGSALKGLARSWAQKAVEQGIMDQAVVDVLFGQGGESPEKADTGYLVFHDAWWVPDDLQGQHQVKPKPYVPEIITVHAEKYYQSKGQSCPHPDLESPNPNNQIAVQGKFYFVVEGKRNWAELGMAYLRQGLEEDGIGGKVASGYGYFKFSDKGQQGNIIAKAEKMYKQEQERRRKGLEQFRNIMAQMRKEEELAGKDRFEKAIDMLREALASGTGHLSKNSKDNINELVNRMIKDETEWPKNRRLEAFPVIRQAYQMTLRGKKRSKRLKKIERVQAWVDST